MAGPHILSNSLMVGMKALRLDVLDEKRQLVTRASGFVIHDQDGLFLYTSWHVVTGVDFLQPNPLAPPIRRAFVRIYFQDVQERQPGVQAIGGSQSAEIALHDIDRNYLWQQEPNSREQADLDVLGLRVPKFFDLVRIPCSLDSLVRPVVEFTNADVFSNLAGAGTDVVIAGYPYGYSAMDLASPEPVFLKRAIASNRTSNVGVVLLDGGATPGMSGAPVLIFQAGRWWIIGMYSGVLFPDHQHGPAGPSNDRFASLGLMVPIHLARAFMKVPGIFERS